MKLFHWLIECVWRERSFEQIDFDDIINQCAAVKEKRILGLKLSAEPKTLYSNNQKMPLVSDFKVFSCTLDMENIVV